MRIKIDATPDELNEKGDALIKALMHSIAPVCPELAEQLEKALPEKPPTLRYRALRDIHEITKKEYQKTLEAMHLDIARVLDDAANGTSAGQEFQKAMGSEKANHKYIKREGAPGHYEYTYAEPAGQASAPTRQPEIPRPTQRLSPEDVIAIERQANTEGKQAGHDMAAGDDLIRQKGSYVLVSVPLDSVEADSDNPDVGLSPSQQARVQEYAAKEGTPPPIRIGHSAFAAKKGKQAAFVANGNHRVAAARIQGKTHIDAMMPEADYNRWLQTRGQVGESLAKAMGGPFIGPRGGKWADAAHTIHWEEAVPHEQIVEDAHAAVKEHVTEGAMRAAAVGADAASLKYVGAGGEGMIFADGQGRAYKVSRHRSKARPDQLRNEAEAMMALADSPVAHMVPKVHGYDETHDVISCDMIQGASAGWGQSRKMHEAYTKIAAELSKRGWGAPEFKEDSFIVPQGGGDPIMVDMGFVHPKGKVLAAQLKRRVENLNPEDDWFDLQLDVSHAYQDNAIDLATAMDYLTRGGAGIEGVSPEDVAREKKEIEFTARTKGDLKAGQGWDDIGGKKVESQGIATITGQSVLEAWEANDSIDTDTPVGLRVMSDDQDLAIGSSVPNSHVWEDGDYTDEELDGASAIKLNNYGQRLALAQVTEALKRLKPYKGTYIALIMGDNAKGGEDPGELVIASPKIVAVWKKEGGVANIKDKKPSDPQVGDKVPVTVHPTITGREEETHPYRVVSTKGDTVQLSRHEGSDYGPKMPVASLKHFQNDLAGKVDLPPSGNPDIDAVTSGKAKFLGKGDDGLAFKVGDKVVKVSTTVPAVPENPGHRTPEEAVAMLKKQVDVGNAMADAGVPGIQRSEFVQHGDKGFQIKPWVEIPEKFTREQLDAVQDSIIAMHKQGYALNDEPQAGLDAEGKPVMFDVGKAEKNAGDPMSSDSHASDDMDRLRFLYEKSGHEFVRRDYSQGQKLWDAYKKEDVLGMGGRTRNRKYERHILDRAVKQLEKEARATLKGPELAKRLAKLKEDAEFEAYAIGEDESAKAPEAPKAPPLELKPEPAPKAKPKRTPVPIKPPEEEAVKPLPGQLSLLGGPPVAGKRKVRKPVQGTLFNMPEPQKPEDKPLPGQKKLFKALVSG